MHLHDSDLIHFSVTMAENVYAQLRDECDNPVAIGELASPTAFWLLGGHSNQPDILAKEYTTVLVVIQEVLVD